MMPQSILITGGAGFIGRQLAAALLERGDRVRIIDCLLPQAHGQDSAAALPQDAELIRADVREADALERALNGVDKVVHLAAEVGVGQSMYAIERYVGANDAGTAALFQALLKRPLARVVTASSMSIYGEGLYRDVEGQAVEPMSRPTRGAAFDPTDTDGRPLAPVPTPEWKRPALASVYALTKFVQERLTLTLCPPSGMEGVALRLFNVYGPGQALSNPYTGVLANFATCILAGARPLVFEDGRQQRDFIHVADGVAALTLALDHPAAANDVFNIGSGQALEVAAAASAVAAALGREDLEPEIVGARRAGDVRHCFADVSKASKALGYAPKVALADGLQDLAAWVLQQPPQDFVPQARQELEQRGLVA